MTAAPDGEAAFLAIHLPTIAKAYVAIFMTVWCVGVLTVAVTLTSKGSAAAIVPVIMAVLGATIGVRTFRMSVTCDGDALVVHNFFRTRRVTRGEIEGFRSGAMSNQPLGRTIYTVLRDGSVMPLDAAGRLYRFGRGRTLLGERLAALTAWLDRGTERT